ncbi:GGDEF domain-containing protein [Aeromonas tecta]|uniref:GGDEF domain-containing protein n=1 Tax=Aeromonas tecta TaxID=324617 RepID=UPI00068360E9|nr:GGDEF domain-containing protein [Aeromonas tecta]
MIIHTPTLLLLSLAINLMSASLMLFIHQVKPGRRNFLLWSLSAFAFSLSILLLSLGILTRHPAWGFFFGGLVSLVSVLLLLAGFYALYDKPPAVRITRRVVVLLLLGYGILATQIEVRLVLACMESALYLWCACLIFSLSRHRQRVLCIVSCIYLVHFVVLLSQGIALLIKAAGTEAWLLDAVFFMHMILTVGSVLLLPLVAYIETESELTALSERDPLTDLLNRRGLFKQAHRYCQEGEVQELPLSVVVLDIDHFKLVNDNFGHHCGDEVIRFVAQILLSESRKDDLIGRIGGEEFAIIMPGVNEHDALSICDRIRSQIELRSAQGACPPCAGVTVSVGGVCAPADRADLEHLLGRADAAMYRVKQNGRNGVQFAPGPERLRLVDTGEI